MSSTPAQFMALAPSSPTPLVTQIERAIRTKVDSGVLRVGARLPSIRGMSRDCGVSTATVIDAYNRLVAGGYLEARRASGYFVASRVVAGISTVHAACDLPTGSVAALLRAYEEAPFDVHAGSGWLPEEWLYDQGVKFGLRAVSRAAGAHLVRYGHPYGYRPLRQMITRQLAAHGLEIAPEQVVLTAGASQALTLLVCLLVKPGETVFCDDPGYSNLIALLKQSGAKIVGVPRTPSGPDLVTLEQLAAIHRPKVFFTSTALQNPTGTSYTPAVAFQVLKVADQNDFLIVEDDIFADLQDAPTQTLAGLDGLRRVIYVQSFSKSIAPSLRVGYIACGSAMAAAVLKAKIYSSLSTSEINERIVLAILSEGHHRKHLELLRRRLERAQHTVCAGLKSAGMRLFHEPGGGMFVWASFERDVDIPATLQLAARRGIVLSPGNTYTVDGAMSPWFRFNVARSDDARLYRFLESASSKAPGPITSSPPEYRFA